MKKLFITAMLLLSVLGANAQGKIYNLDVKKDSVNRSPAKPNGDYAIFNGQQYPVYESTHGKLYIMVTSKKSGKQYRKYIK